MVIERDRQQALVGGPPGCFGWLGSLVRNGPFVDRLLTKPTVGRGALEGRNPKRPALITIPLGSPSSIEPPLDSVVCRSVRRIFGRQRFAGPDLVQIDVDTTQQNGCLVGQISQLESTLEKRTRRGK